MSKNAIRPAIRELEPSGITKVTALGLGNPDVLPLWFGETDLVTPPFIRQAAAQALEDGKTFYPNAGGTQTLRRHACGGDRPADGVRNRRQCRDCLAHLAQHLPGDQSGWRRAAAGADGRGLECGAVASGPRQAVRCL